MSTIHQSTSIPTSPVLQDLNELLQERGEPIEPRARRRMERFLASDFADVVVHTSRLTDRLNRQLGAKAFAIGNHVCFSESAYEPNSERGSRLLAHELAHVAQQRLGLTTRHHPSSAPCQRRLIEIEADIAAENVLMEKQYDCVIPDASGSPACWDLAGHYYTPYLIFLNAGVDPEEARRLALWCWLPDQVSELDAKTIELHSLGVSWNDADKFHDRKNYRKMFEKLGRYSFTDYAQYVRVVHKGIHVFTGGNAVRETERRENIFTNGKSDALLYRGLALHAFGDCFAHRRLGLDSDALFSAGLGHAGEGGGVDEIWHKERSQIYVTYVRHMAALARQYSKKADLVAIDDIVAALSAMLQGTLVFNGGKDHGRKHVGVTWSNVKEAAKRLSESTVTQTEDGCGAHICRIAAELLGINMRKIEGRDPVPWEKYCLAHPELQRDSGGFLTNDYIFFKILECAVTWSQESLAFDATLGPIRPPRRVS